MTDIQTGTILDEACVVAEKIDEVLPALENQETLVEGCFTWQIDNWIALRENRYVSPSVKIGDFDWNLLLFPHGNRGNGVAIYLAPHPEEKLNEETGKMEPVDPDWYCCCQFGIVFSRPTEDLEVNTVSKSHHRFNCDETDWGFANVMELNHSNYPAVKGKQNHILVKNGKLNITVFIRLLKDPTGVLWHNFVNYDSKKVTGYVGFKNQGATCYLNSLLQSYYFTKYFRKLVYQIPTADDSPNDSVPLALQRSFYQLQVSNLPLDTVELTRSFGWDSDDAFTQHDVQELNRILMDRLEYRMKSTPLESKLSEIFVGKMKSYIKCINIDFESSRVEDFWDLQLNVKNLKNLKQSFEKYIEMELLNGENQYAAQDHGLQDAQMGVIFEYFPPVLHLQLKRFEYDFNYDQLIKINDPYEFPDTFDVSPYLDPSSKQLENSESHIYKLHGVLVHAGDISTGHYYTLIKPGVAEEWYRFDDEKVWKVTKREVFDENFGIPRLPEERLNKMSREEYQDYMLERHTSAYMLVYIRKDKELELLQSVTNEDVPDHIIERVEKENREREAREKEIRDAHLYFTFNIFSLENFIDFKGLDPIPNKVFEYSYEDLNDGKEVSTALKVRRSKKLKDIFDEIKTELGIPLQRNVNYWKFGYRNNNTLRIREKLMSEDENSTLQEVLRKHGEDSFSYLHIFVEEPYLEMNFLMQLYANGQISSITLDQAMITELRENLTKILEAVPNLALTPFDEEKSKIIFFKKFDAVKQQLCGFGYMLVDITKYVNETFDKIRSCMNQSNISFYEEISKDNIIKFDVPADTKFYNLEMCHGDILTMDMQYPIQDGTSVFPLYSTVIPYYEYLGHRVRLRFSKSCETNEEYVDENSPDKRFEIWVSAYIDYQKLSKIIANQVGCDPEYLKVISLYSNGRYVLKSNCILNDCLLRDNNCALIPPFEYEVLTIPLKDFEHLISVKFYWLNNNYIHYQSYEFDVPTTSTGEEFLDKIQAKIGFSDEDKSKILIWTNSNFKFASIISNDTVFKNIPKKSLIFGRVLPEELAIYKEITGIADHQTKNINSDEYDGEEDCAMSNSSSSSSSASPSDREISMTPENELHANNNNALNINGTNKLIKPVGKLIIVSQFFKERENRHGISFVFHLLPNETFIETSKRLHKRFGLGDKEFSKIRLYVSFNNGRKLVIKPLFNYTPEDLNRIVLYERLNNWDSILMDHPDRLRSHSSSDRPMVIKN